MTKPIREYRFREIEGIWRDIRGDNEILADVLEQYSIIVDDRCQFARIYDYERHICFYYRVDGGLITLILWKIDS